MTFPVYTQRKKLADLLWILSLIFLETSDNMLCHFGNFLFFFSELNCQSDVTLLYGGVFKIKTMIKEESNSI